MTIKKPITRKMFAMQLAWKRKYTNRLAPTNFSHFIMLSEYYTIMLSGYGFDSLEEL